MSDPGEFTHDLFISHAEAELEWVEGALIPALGLRRERVLTPGDFRLGATKVGEYEHAVAGSRFTLLVLSPDYLADVWAVFGEQLASYLAVTGQEPRFIPLVRRPAPLPLRIQSRISLDCTRDEALAGEAARLRGLLGEPEPEPENVPCPYPGMVPFGEADSGRFFGRMDERAEMLKRLRKHPTLAVIGPSGSGKSSLVAAGLVPDLRTSQWFGAGALRVIRMRPGRTPAKELASALGAPSPEPDAVLSALLAAAGTDSRCLLFVDQFEELFTQAEPHEPEDARRFLECLRRVLEQLPRGEGAGAAPPHFRCLLVVTIRADFYANLMASPLWPWIQQHRYELPPLGREGLRAAIEEPAKKVGVFIEARLVDRLVEDADAPNEPGVLPLVQETLVLLWKESQHRLLPLSAYENLGREGQRGLYQAMREHADAVMQGLASEEQRNLARRILLRLIQFGQGRPDTRRTQRVGALRAVSDDASAFERTLAHLTEGRLLTLSHEDPGEPPEGAGDDSRKVDLAHEKLITAWPTLQALLSRQRADEQVRRRLEAKAREWERLQSQGGGLLDEVELREAEQWMAGQGGRELGYSPRLRDLVRASREAIEKAARQRQAEQRRELNRQKQLAESRRRTNRLLAAGASLLAVSGVVAILQGHEAARRATEARAEAMANLAYAVAEEDPTLSLRLAEESVAIHRTRSAELALIRAFNVNSWLYSGTWSGIWDADLSPDGGTLLVVDDEGGVQTVDVATLERRPWRSELRMSDARWLGDGATAVLWNDQGQGSLRKADGTVLQQLEFPSERAEVCPQGRRLLVTDYTRDDEGLKATTTVVKLEPGTAPSRFQLPVFGTASEREQVVDVLGCLDDDSGFVILQEERGEGGGEWRVGAVSWTGASLGSTRLPPGYPAGWALDSARKRAATYVRSERGGVPDQVVISGLDGSPPVTVELNETFGEAGSKLRFLPDGSKVLVFSTAGWAVRVDTRSGAVEPWTDEQSRATDTLAVHEGEVYAARRSGFVSVYDEHGHLVSQLRTREHEGDGNNAAFERMAVSADGASVYTLSRGGTLRLWRRPGWRLLHHHDDGWRMGDELPPELLGALGRRVAARGSSPGSWKACSVRGFKRGLTVGESGEIRLCIQVHGRQELIFAAPRSLLTGTLVSGPIDDWGYHLDAEDVSRVLILDPDLILGSLKDETENGRMWRMDEQTRKSLLSE